MRVRRQFYFEATMPQLTLKEWAAEYRTANDWEQQERLARLPEESPAKSVRDYFALTTMLVELSGEPAETGELWALRLKHYQTLIDKWLRLARQSKHAN
jgi:hypothetical protein